MDFMNKYLKYKNKYLELKKDIYDGGFIKTNTKNPCVEENYNKYIDIIDDNITLKAECKDDKKIISDIVNYYMPLYKINNNTDNIILINDENYILVDHRNNEEYQLLRLNADFTIEIVSKPYPLILDDNIIIEDLNSVSKTHNILESYYLFINNFFLKLVNIDIKDSKYYYYKILINELYKNIGEDDKPILYNNSTDNFILKLIFINKLPKIIDILNNFDDIIIKDTTDYTIYTKNTGYILKITRDKTKKKKLIAH
jgi:hypothetical protein